MFGRRQFLSSQLIFTLSLFLIGSLHMMIFSIFQIPENFLLGRKSAALTLLCKGILYLFAIGTSLAHQLICRNIGLRKALYFGLVCNCFGLSTLLSNQSLLSGQGNLPLIFLNMALFGMALTSVINALVTYIIITFPKHIGIGIVSLFAFFNLGAMFAPLLVESFNLIAIKELMYVFLILLLLLSIWFVHAFFFDPPVSAEKIHLKKEGLIWKKLHYRLALFVLAMGFYGLTETTFNLWGYVKIERIFGAVIANETTPFFWMFLIIGQVLLLIPLYFLPARRIFYFLVFVLIGASFYLPLQNSLAGFLVGLSIAGFGCSAVSPILLSQMEREIFSFAKGTQIFPYIEKSTSLMIGGYFVGVGSIDLWIEVLQGRPDFFQISHFHLAALFSGAIGSIAFFLNRTAHR